jgi:hypothetical protein
LRAISQTGLQQSMFCHHVGDRSSARSSSFAGEGRQGATPSWRQRTFAFDCSNLPKSWIGRPLCWSTQRAKPQRMVVVLERQRLRLQSPCRLLEWRRPFDSDSLKPSAGGDQQTIYCLDEPQGHQAFRVGPPNVAQF